MKRNVVAIAVGIVLAMLGSLAVLVYVRSADSRALAGKRAVSVLVATKRIPAGTTGARIRTGKDPHQVPRVLLPRVEVIAVGDKTSTGSSTSTPDTEQAAAAKEAGATLTVAVNQQEAERLIHVLQTGTLYFALLDESSDI